MNILKYVLISTVSLGIVSSGEAQKNETKVETVAEETNSMSWYTKVYYKDGSLYNPVLFHKGKLDKNPFFKD